MSLAGVWYNPNILPTQDIPNGAIDGSNTIFALLFLPMPGTLNIYVNGLYQTPGVSYVFNQDNLIVTFATAPPLGATLAATYLH